MQYETPPPPTSEHDAIINVLTEWAQQQHSGANKTAAEAWLALKAAAEQNRPVSQDFGA